MQAIQEQATPCASREPLIFTIFQVKNERFSEREISFSVTEAKPGQRRSAALDVSLS
jgi:hypothetical protein